jgi:hypothetical protein
VPAATVPAALRELDGLIHRRVISALGEEELVEAGRPVSSAMSQSVVPRRWTAP